MKKKATIPKVYVLENMFVIFTTDPIYSCYNYLIQLPILTLSEQVILALRNTQNFC